MSLIETRFCGVSTYGIKLGNFYPAELACPHCLKVNILEELWRAVQMMRDAAMAPLIITSGYRCPIHNQAVGGSKDSDHMHGYAADISIPGMSADEVGKLAARFPEVIKRIGIYMNKDFVHVGVCNRGKGTFEFWRVNADGEMVEAQVV